MQKPKIGIVGLGYWGPNWLRNFASLDTCTVAYACDMSDARCKKFAALYPAITFTKHYEDLLKDTSIDAIVIATPTSTHFSLAKAALEHGKHVLVEKPMTGNIKDADTLVQLSKKHRKLLLVDHTFSYTQSVAKIREYIDAKKLGQLLYFDSTRINLGIIQKDTNVFYDLAIHDLTILAAVADLSDITEVYATGHSYFGKTIEMGHAHLTFASGFSAHIHVSWLSPVKIRSTLIAGKKAMIVYDDTQPSEKIRLYDKGIDRDDTKPDPFFPKYRSGDVLIPALQLTEALETQAKHFVECIQGTAKPLVSAEDGRQMIKILEAITQSCIEKKIIKMKK